MPIKHLVEREIKKFKKVNGKVVEDIEIRNITDDTHQQITGHYGNMPINIVRTFSNVSGKFPWDTRKSLTKRKKTKGKAIRKSGKSGKMRRTMKK